MKREWDGQMIRASGHVPDGPAAESNEGYCRDPIVVMKNENRKGYKTRLRAGLLRLSRGDRDN